MKQYKTPALIGVITIVSDFIFHKYFTLEMETFYYFIIKFIVATYIAYFMLENRLNFFSLQGTKKYIYYSLLFALAFSLYYRALEYFTGNPYLSRVPSISIKGIIITSAEYLKSAFAWGIVHGGAFLAGIYASKWK